MEDYNNNNTKKNNTLRPMTEFNTKDLIQIIRSFPMFKGMNLTDFCDDINANMDNYYADNPSLYQQTYGTRYDPDDSKKVTKSQMSRWLSNTYKFGPNKHNFPCFLTEQYLTEFFKGGKDSIASVTCMLDILKCRGFDVSEWEKELAVCNGEKTGQTDEGKKLWKKITACIYKEAYDRYDDKHKTGPKADRNGRKCENKNNNPDHEKSDPAPAEPIATITATTTPAPETNAGAAPDALLSPRDIDSCVELFLKDWAQTPAEGDRDLIRTIVKDYAYCDPFGVRLLALGCQGYSPAELLKTVQERGFRFEYLEDGKEKNAAEALLKYCVPENLPERQKQIMTQFALLPRNMVLTTQECGTLFGFKRTELVELLSAHRLIFENGNVINPLLRESVLRYYNRNISLLQGKKLPLLVTSIIEKKLITAQDGTEEIWKKLQIADGFAQGYKFEKETEAVFFHGLGMAVYENTRLRLRAVQYLKKAEKAQRRRIRAEKGSKKDLELQFAAILYDLAYVKSTTNDRYGCAEMLHKALNIWSAQPEKFLPEIIRAKTHLATVLPYAQKKQGEDEKLLTDAKKLLEHYEQINSYTEENESLDISLAWLQILFNSALNRIEKGETEDLKNATDDMYEAGKIVRKIKQETEYAKYFCIQGLLFSKCDDNESALKSFALAEYFWSIMDHARPPMYAMNYIYVIVKETRIFLEENELKKARESLYSALERNNTLEDLEDHSGYYTHYLEDELNYMYNGLNRKDPLAVEGPLLTLYTYNLYDN